MISTSGQCVCIVLVYDDESVTEMARLADSAPQKTAARHLRKEHKLCLQSKQRPGEGCGRAECGIALICRQRTQWPESAASLCPWEAESCTVKQSESVIVIAIVSFTRSIPHPFVTAPACRTVAVVFSFSFWAQNIN